MLAKGPSTKSKKEGAIEVLLFHRRIGTAAAEVALFEVGEEWNKDTGPPAASTDGAGVTVGNESNPPPPLMTLPLPVAPEDA